MKLQMWNEVEAADVVLERLLQSLRVKVWAGRVSTSYGTAP